MLRVIHFKYIVPPRRRTDSATRNITTENKEDNAATRDWTRDLQIFSLTLSQLSYRGVAKLDVLQKGMIG